METRTPKFCSVCGSQLEAQGTRKGFDPFTGAPEVETTLICPNPTKNVRTSRFSDKIDTDYTFHPSWANVGGEWVTARSYEG